MAGQSIAEAFVDIISRIDASSIADVRGAYEKLGEQIQGSMEEAANQSDAALERIGGSDVTGDVAGGFERLGESIQGSMEEAWRQSDAELEKIGGADVTGGILGGFERLGENIEGVFRETSRSADRSMSGAGDTAGKSFTGGFGKGLGGMAAVAGGAIAALGIGTLLSDATSAAAESNATFATTKQLIEQTGGAAGKTAEQIADMAKQQSLKIGVDDDDIIAASNVMLTFKEVSGDTFDTAMGLASDMSTVFGQDLSGSATQLGKALNDPIAGVSALGRVGVQFTDDQKAMIKSMVESGDIAGAQGIIMDEVAGQVGGAAEAAATGGQKIGVAVGEMKEALGGGIAGAIERIAPSVVDAMGALEAPLATVGEELGGALSGAFEAIGPALTPLANTLGTILKVLGKAIEVVAPLFEPLMQIIDVVADLLAAVLMPALDALKPVFSIIAGAIGEVVAILGPALMPLFKSLGDIVLALSPVLSAIAGVVGQLLVAAATALAPVLTVVSDLFAVLAPIVSEIAGILIDALMPVIEALMPAFGALIPAVVPLLELFAELVEMILPPLVDILGIIMPIFSALAVLLSDVVVGAITDVVNIFAGIVTMITNNVRPVFDALVTFFTEDVVNAFKAVWSFIRDKVIPIFQSISDKVTEVAKWVGDKVTAIVGWVTGIPGKIGAVVATMWDGLKNGITGAATWVSEKVSAIVGFITGIPGKIASAVSDFAAKGLEMGSKFIQNLKDGITNIVGFAGDVASSVVGAVKDAWNVIAGKINNFVPNEIGWGPFSLDLPDNPIPTFAQGVIASSPTLGMFGEAGTEVVIPITRPRRAMELMNETGLTDLALSQGGRVNGPLVSMHGTVIQDATDADLVAQRTLAALSMSLVAS